MGLSAVVIVVIHDHTHLLYLWGFVFCPCFVMQYLLSYLVCNNLNEEKSVKQTKSVTMNIFRKQIFSF